MPKNDPVSLPYDFIPFPENQNWHYEYELNELPKHNDNNNFSGFIKLNIKPYSDLSMDFRDLEKGKKYCVMGSALRGVLRTNIEILSKSYPIFIERAPTFMYRDFAGSLKDDYFEKLLGENTKDRDIESTICVGYLEKVDNKFIVTPAEPILNKNFKSVEEFRLVESGVLNKENQFYNYSQNDMELLKKILYNIYSLNEKIKSHRVSKNYSDVTLMALEIFFKKQCNFKTKNYKELEPKDVENNVKTELIKILGAEDELVEMYSKRLRYKFEWFIYYNKQIKALNNFTPYEHQLVFYTGNLQNFQKTSPTGDESFQKGYLFCSTNASSKKRHYIVGEKSKSSNLIPVEENLRNAYNQMYKNFRPPTSIKKNNSLQTENYNFVCDFYNLFKFSKEDKPKVVFYTMRNGQISSIGRTPYMKVSYDYSIGDYIKTEKNKKIDFARSLFGFVEDDLKLDVNLENKNELNYKGRLRVEPIIIDVSSAPKEIECFNLSQPKPTCFAMYLNQCGLTDKQKSYNDSDSKLNGYKFYKKMDKSIEVSRKDKGHTSNRMVLKKEFIDLMSCKVHFKNLTEVELALLIIALVPEKAKMFLTNENELGNNSLYESIGGAKSYGYGKVKMEIVDDKIHLVNSGDEKHLPYWFGSQSQNCDEILKNTIERLRGIIDQNVLHSYIKSKESLDLRSEENINWENLGQNSKNKGGYPKEWVLKSQNCILKNAENVKSNHKPEKDKTYSKSELNKINNSPNVAACTFGDLFKGKWNK